MDLVNTSELQKSGRIRVAEKAITTLEWKTNDILIQFLDEKEKALIVKNIRDVVKQK